MKNHAIPKEDKDAFCEAFLRARENGMTIRAAYQQARGEMSMAGRTSPGFSTLEFWLRHGHQNPKKAPEAPEVPEVPEAPEAPADADPQDRLAVYQDLLRAYRLRRECDIDRLLDRLAPELLEDTNA